MAHYQQLKFVKNFSEYFIKNKELNILELGSYNYNGTIRNFFQIAIILGLTWLKGPMWTLFITVKI